MKSLTKIVLALLFSLLLTPARSQEFLGDLSLSDSAAAYLITCGPGNDFYTTFGHTALRITDPAIHLDKVYNYGTFDFNTPHFYLTFARGKLDYCLSRTDFGYFMAEYIYEGRWVRQQRLRLSQNELDRLFKAVEDNYLKENRYYKYDFFRDNCATRVRDMIEESLEEKAFFDAVGKNRPLEASWGKHLEDNSATYRQLLQKYTGGSLMWWQFGIDLLLGQRCDQLTSPYEQMFLPSEFMAQMDTLHRKTTERQLLAENQELLLPETRIPPKPSIDPAIVFWIIFAAAAALTALQMKKNWHLAWLDIILFALAATMSVVLILMWVATDHYCTKFNWNLLWANPLFIYIIARRRHPSRWVTLALMAMLILAASGLVPQHLNPAAMPIALTLFIRTIPLLTKTKKMRNRLLITTVGLILLLGCTTARAQQQAVNKYKGYHQVTLYDSTRVVMEESGLSHVVNHRLIRMIDQTGCRNNSVVKIDYDPLSAYVEFREVKVYRNDGSTTTLIGQGGNASVYDYVAPARLIYWGASQKMVEVGHLEPGEELEITTYRKGFTYALLGADDDSRYIPPMRGHFYDIVPFWASQPVNLKVYQVSVPASKTLRYMVYNGTVDTAAARQGSNLTYTFTRRDIMPLKKEPATLASNDIECKLLLSTAPDWQSKSVWFYNVNEDYGSFKSTPEVSAKVRELLKDARNEQDSISILTHWVADNIRYAGISMGKGEGYTLHNAQMNYTDRCGVCKDKAGMLITMLRAAGFKAYAAMTMAGERIDNLPADQFNHSVCAVQHRNGRMEMLDPTWVPNLRELWSSAEQQQGYLIGMPGGADLQYTPLSAADKHYLRINGKSAISKDGTLKGTVTITAEGQSDQAVRGVFSCRTSEWRRNLELELLKIDPRAEITKVTHTDNDQYLQQPVSITYHYTIPGYATVTDNEVIFIPLTARNFYSRAMQHLGFDTTLQTRLYPFHDRTSRLVEITEQIKLPAKYSRISFAHRIRGIVTPAVNYGCSYWLDNGQTLTFGESVMLNKRIYDAADWPAFRHAIINQKTLATTPVVVIK